MGGPLCGLQTADSSSCPHVGGEKEEESAEDVGGIVEFTAATFCLHGKFVL